MKRKNVGLSTKVVLKMGGGGVMGVYINDIQPCVVVK